MKRAVEFSEYVFWIETLDEEMKRQLQITDKPKCAETSAGGTK